MLVLIWILFSSLICLFVYCKRMKYIILIFLLAIVSCNDAEDDEIYINDFPHRISEPPLLDNKGDTAFIIMTPAEGWRLHAAGTVVNKDSIALNVKMTHTFLLEEDWFSIKKEQEDSVMTVIVDENTSGDIREIILWLSYIGSSMSTYTIKQNP